jgi:uncharacterized protein YwqG
VDRQKLIDPIVPLIFLGQIFLDEIPHYGNFPNLPDSGILYFFCDCLRQPSGWRPSSKGSCRVVYVKDITGLETLSFPWNTIKKFRSETEIQNNIPRCGLTFEPNWCLSNYIGAILEEVNDDNQGESIINSYTQESFEKIPYGFPDINESAVLIKDHSFSGKPMHLMFGSPMEMQSPMEEMC